jgi:hypothetical protein
MSFQGSLDFSTRKASTMHHHAHRTAKIAVGSGTNAQRRAVTYLMQCQAATYLMHGSWLVSLLRFPCRLLDRTPLRVFLRNAGLDSFGE